MRTVKLEIESLSVDSFSTESRGTVVAPAEARLSADCSVVCTFEWDCTV